MRRLMLLAGLVAVLSTTGCYTSRRVVGDELRGGVGNPALWVTVPIDAVMSPYQIPKWLADDQDDWRPWDPDETRRSYNPERFEPIDLTR